MRYTSILLPVLLLLSALTVSGCGKKGPLYLPAPAPAHAPAKPPATTPDTATKSTDQQ